MTRGVIILAMSLHLGPKTQIKRLLDDQPPPQGKARQIAANTKHGNETRAVREKRSAKLAELYELEMLGRELGLISGGMVGRKRAKR